MTPGAARWVFAKRWRGTTAFCKASTYYITESAVLLIASVAGFEARRSFLQATYTEFLPNALLKIFLFFLICIVLSKEVMNYSISHRNHDSNGVQ